MKPNSRTDDYQQAHLLEVDPGSSRIGSEQCRRFWERLGTYNLCIIVVSPLAVICSIALLAVLWRGAEQAIHGGHPSLIWLHIHNKSWETRIVTVSSVIIRVAVTAQASTFAALVAALVLEKTAVSIKNIPTLSMIRAMNTGPHSHVWSVLDLTQKWTISRYLYVTSIALTVLSSLALQFTSTLLLGDFGPATVVLGLNSTRLTYGLTSGLGSTPIHLLSGYDYWKTAPAIYPQFAEYGEHPFEAEGYIDTGKTLRAFFPLGASQQREVLRSYSGPATVYDARTVCIKPRIEISNITGLYGFYVLVSGRIMVDDYYPALNLTGATDFTFKCPMYMNAAFMIDYINTTFWPISLCHLRSDSSAWGNALFTDSIVNSTTFLKGVMAEKFLLLNSSLTSNKSSPIDDVRDLDHIDWVRNSSGPWTTMSTTNASTGFELALNMTLCLAASSANNFKVEASGTAGDQPELAITWNALTSSYATDQIRNMLGAASRPQSLDQRGIYFLHAPNNWTAEQYNQTTYTLVSRAVYSGNWVADGSGNRLTDASIMLFPFDFSSTHLTNSAIFQDALRETNNPALALQAVLTIISQTAYYDQLPLFDMSDEATYSNKETIMTPVQWNGFIGVMGLLVLHFALVGAAVGVFLMMTKESLLGNTWQTVAYVVDRGDTGPIAAKALHQTDTEVEKLIKKRSGASKAKQIEDPPKDGGRSIK